MTTTPWSSPWPSVSVSLSTKYLTIVANGRQAPVLSLSRHSIEEIVPLEEDSQASIEYRNRMNAEGSPTERVAGDELFEDALLLAAGEFVGAADMRGAVRTFLPFDVTAADASTAKRSAAPRYTNEAVGAGCVTTGNATGPHAHIQYDKYGTKSTSWYTVRRGATVYTSTNVGRI